MFSHDSSLSQGLMNKTFSASFCLAEPSAPFTWMFPGPGQRWAPSVRTEHLCSEPQ